MIGYSHIKDNVLRAEPDNQKIARALINQIIAECNIAKTKLLHEQDCCDAEEILQQLKDIQAQIFNVNCQMEALPSERELHPAEKQEQELQLSEALKPNGLSLFDSFWVSY